MKENCTECKHHDVFWGGFWGGSGCNLLNNGERCKFEPKVMTNADRIRTMSDEELAHELALIAGWDREQYKKANRIGIENFMLSWLRIAAEETHDN